MGSNFSLSCSLVLIEFHTEFHILFCLCKKKKLNKELLSLGYIIFVQDWCKGEKVKTFMCYSKYINCNLLQVMQEMMQEIKAWQCLSICRLGVMVLTAAVRGLRAKAKKKKKKRACNDVNTRSQLNTRALTKCLFMVQSWETSRICPPFSGEFLFSDICVSASERRRQRICTPSPSLHGTHASASAASAPSLLLIRGRRRKGILVHVGKCRQVLLHFSC